MACFFFQTRNCSTVAWNTSGALFSLRVLYGNLFYHRPTIPRALKSYDRKAFNMYSCAAVAAARDTRRSGRISFHWRAEDFTFSVQCNVVDVSAIFLSVIPRPEVRSHSALVSATSPAVAQVLPSRRSRGSLIAPTRTMDHPIHYLTRTHCVPMLFTKITSNTVTHMPAEQTVCAQNMRVRGLGLGLYPKVDSSSWWKEKISGRRGQSVCIHLFLDQKYNLCGREGTVSFSHFYHYNKRTIRHTAHNVEVDASVDGIYCTRRVINLHPPVFICALRYTIYCSHTFRAMCVGDALDSR